MEKLLRESEFANMWNKSIPGYLLTSTRNTHIKHIYINKHCIATLIAIVHLKNNLPCYLILNDVASASYLSGNILHDFISDYKIEPYTYIFCVGHANGYLYTENYLHYLTSQNLKPFSWLVTCNIPESDLSKLPICVVSSNESVRSVVKMPDIDFDDEIFYGIARKLQNGEPITKMKNANN